MRRNLWQELREQTYRPLSTLKGRVHAIDPMLETSLEGTLNYIMFRIGKFEKKLVRHLKKAEHLTATQLVRAAEVVYPRGDLQERTLNAMSYLGRYGLGLFDALMQAVPESHGKHHMVELS